MRRLLSDPFVTLVLLALVTWLAGGYLVDLGVWLDRQWLAAWHRIAEAVR